MVAQDATKIFLDWNLLQAIESSVYSTEVFNYLTHNWFSYQKVFVQK